MVTINDEPWFVMKDVMEPLRLSGYQSDYAQRLQKEEICKVTRSSQESFPRVKEAFFTTQAGIVTLISESGLYTIILRSNKPEARFFQNWVTQDVLPAIRKDGMFVLGEEKIATG